MNLPTIILGLIVAAVFISIVTIYIINRKKGKSSCSCCSDCKSCGMNGNCHR